MDVADLVESAALRYGPRLAFKDARRSVTFAEAYDESRRLAAGLREIGVRAGDRVGVLVGNQVEYPIVEFAIGILGGTRVPMLVGASRPEIAEMVSEAGLGVVLADSLVVDHARSSIPESVSTTVIEVGSTGSSRDCTAALIAEHAPIDHRVAATPDVAHAMRFTGGTTGRPKGVVMNHRSFSTGVIFNAILNWRLDQSDRCVHVHPLSHASGLLLYPMFVRGAANIFEPAFGFDPERYAATIYSEEATWAWVVPTVIYELLDSKADLARDLGTMRTMLYGGSPMARDRLREAVSRVGPRFVQTYGCSEAAMVLATLPADDHVETGNEEMDRRLASVGRIALNVELEVWNTEGQRCSDEEMGEIVTRGDHVTDGYWNRPELTAERFAGGWFRTGDVGQIDRHGYLHVLSRKDDLIITGGFNVYPAEVEQALASHPAVTEVVVFAVDHPKWGDAVVGVVRLRCANASTEDDLRSYVRERLAPYKVPKALALVVEALPMTPVGKLDRTAVRRHFKSQISTTLERTRR